MICRHCKQDKKCLAAKGLCNRCYKFKHIRDSYPSQKRGPRSKCVSGS